jgi:outer membrane biogenesis lipoprotein LolB
MRRMPILLLCVVALAALFVLVGCTMEVPKPAKKPKKGKPTQHTVRSITMASTTRKRGKPGALGTRAWNSKGDRIPSFAGEV